MAQRHVHYEAAFEDYVRSRGWPYVPVDEQRKAIFGGARIKSFDFLVYRSPGEGWLVDVKGRKFPYTLAGGRRYWENWVTREDIDDLYKWKGVFGDGFEPVFVFAYWLSGVDIREPGSEIHTFKDELYAFLWVSVNEYERRARMRSPRWDTVAMSTRDFREIVQPVHATR